VVVLSSRKGTLGWTRELEKLPGQLSSLVPESFLMVYPSEVEGGAGGGAGEGTDVRKPVRLPSTLDPSRIVLDASGATYREVLRNILSSHFSPGAEMAGILERLSDAEEEFSSEIRPGVALPHALIPGLEEPIMFLGLCPNGVRFPNAETPAKAVFILLGASEKRYDHLRLLTRTARLLRTAAEVEPLVDATDLEGVKSWFAKHAAEALPTGPHKSKKELQRRK
jgi:mannitol/fructose-specific phosphotransferase system IIA component (Ntr-type)